MLRVNALQKLPPIDAKRLILADSDAFAGGTRRGVATLTLRSLTFDVRAAE
jgi:hypothetical protein